MSTRLSTTAKRSNPSSTRQTRTGLRRLPLVAALSALALLMAACAPVGGGAGGGNMAPVANAGSDVSGFAPLAVAFSSAGSSDPDGSIASYRWEFGDGSPSDTTANPTHTYTFAGSFSASLTVTDNLGATATDTVTVDVTLGSNQSPVAVIGAAPIAGKSPLTVAFSSAGSNDPDGSIVSYSWDWGDGTALGTAPNPSHTYAAAGTYAAKVTVTDNRGATSSATQVITTTPNLSPTAVATATPPNGVVPLAVVLDSSASADPDGTIVSRRWNFGDGSPLSSAVTPSKTYSAPGTYTVSLLVTDDSGATDSTSLSIVVLTVNQLPVAVANGTPSTGKAPLTVAFSSVGSTDNDGSIVSYSWNFGDGSPVSALPNPSYTYTVLGSYTAVLTITDNRGGTTSASVPISVGPTNVAPVAVPTATPSTGKAPLTVAFDSAGSSDSDGTIVSRSWNFGDGSLPSSSVSPTYVYATPGTYTAVLTVTDDDGAVNAVPVTITAVPNIFPTAAAAGTPTSGKGPLLVAFSSTGTNDTDGTISSYSWDFGDGSPADTSANPSHIYAPGNYTATLTVTDDSGDSDTATVSIVSNPNVVPVASANSDLAAGNAPFLVAFSSAGSVDPDGTIAGYSWDFGDGSAPDTTANPSHTYTTAGSYSAVLTVTDNEGAPGSAALTITVNPNPAPVADAAVTSVTPVTGKVPATVVFSSAASTDDGTIVGYAWDFGDSVGTSTAANPTYTYTAVGVYVATVTVTDNGGATNTASVTVTVIPNLSPTAVASATPSSGKAPLSVALSSAGSADPDGTIVSYSWDFGDGSPVSGNANPTKIYGVGTFTATLTVTDDDGNTGSASTTVSTVANVPPVVVANATPVGTTMKAPLTVNFSSAGTVDNDGTIASYSWNFGDPAVIGGGTSTDPNPSHIYSTEGLRTAVLTVTDDSGDSNTGSASINVGPLNVAPVAQAAGTPTSGKRPLTVAFSSAGSTDSDGGIVSYTWDFGDGIGTSTSPNPSYTFAVGTWTATLTVADAEGATNTKSVTINSNPNQAPTAQASATPSFGRIPLPVAFSSAGSADPDDSIVGYAWDFGDGIGTSTSANPGYTYTTVGTFVATLTVTDQEGATGTRTVNVVANPNAAPVAVANSDTTSGLAPLTVAFSSAASNDPDGLATIAGYSWDFGDGSPADTTPNPSYTYNTPGTYVATLTVTDDLGLTATDSRTITALSSVVYVRSDGNNANLGTPTSPKLTIQGALTSAASLGQTSVQVAGGSYGSFTVVAGIDVTGGYDQSFVDGGGNGATTVTVTAASGPAVTATGATVATTLRKLTIQGGGGADATGLLAQTNSVLTLDTVVVNSGAATGAGNSAYGVRAIGGSNVTITGSTITAQSGVAGAAGTGGAGGDNATGGNNAAGGNNASGGTLGAAITGQTPPTRNSGGGGNGGGGGFSLTTSQQPGAAGTAGGGGATGGTGGPANSNGVGGGGGGAGVAGAATAGGTAGSTTPAPGTTFVGGTGGVGGAGGSGTGGGGGGGGGGANQFSGAPKGGSGGSGALGSLGGSGGLGGTSGGGSFAIYVSNATVSVTGSVLTSNNGGAGGSGGAGGVGGAGGTGGNGGNVTNGAAGGGGGGGGAGGRGGSGAGGGAGGPSVGAYKVGSGTLTLNSTTANIGSAGAGGAAGTAGTGGAAGVGGVRGTSNNAARQGTAGVNGAAGGSGNAGTAGVTGVSGSRVPANVVPIAAASALPTSGKAPLPVGFSSAGSSDPDGTIVSRSWNFGDGIGTSTSANPSYTYTLPGSYTAVLTVADNDGATATSSVVVTVVANAAPTAVANADITSGSAPLAVNFSSAGSADSDGVIVGYSWDFGDLSPLDTSTNPSYTYNDPGTYTAVVTVTDDNGDTATASVVITVT